MAMEPKPSHLGRKYAEQFQDACVAEVYHHRPPYADEAIDVLVALMADAPRAVLDVGCGTGDLARRLAARAEVERVDAVDCSLEMLNKGRTLPGGDQPRLRWIAGQVEEVALEPPYTLITAGESLHWMEWEVVLPLFARVLTPRGALAMAEREAEPCPWDGALLAVIQHYSTNREFQPYDLVAELERRGLFARRGSRRTQPVAFAQSVEDYIRSIHSRNGFSRERMGADAAEAFDAEVRRLLAPFAVDGKVTLAVVSEVVWGSPLPAPARSAASRGEEPTAGVAG